MGVKTLVFGIIFAKMRYHKFNLFAPNLSSLSKDLFSF